MKRLPGTHRRASQKTIKTVCKGAEIAHCQKASLMDIIAKSLIDNWSGLGCLSDPVWSLEVSTWVKKRKTLWTSSAYVKRGKGHRRNSPLPKPQCLPFMARKTTGTKLFFGSDKHQRFVLVLRRLAFRERMIKKLLTLILADLFVCFSFALLLAARWPPTMILIQQLWLLCRCAFITENAASWSSLVWLYVEQIEYLFCWSMFRVQRKTKS